MVSDPILRRRSGPHGGPGLGPGVGPGVGPGAGLVGIAVALALAMAGRLLLGSSGVGWPASEIIGYRVSAVAVGAVVGASLGVSGLLLQVLLRNPLASPFILGLSSGAGFGYMVALYLGWRFGIEVSGPFAAALGVGGPVVSATLGSLLVLGVVWSLGMRQGSPDPLALVLAGVIVGAIASAATTAVQSIVPSGLRGDFLGWMMGRIPEAPPRGLFVCLACLCVAGIAIAWRVGPALDAASASDDEAIAVGVPLVRLRRLLFLLSGLLAAATVPLAGPIGFVGLIGPHAARLILGAKHRPLALGSGLAGAALLVAADAARQLVDLGGGRLPVGVVTALVGGPIFLWLLRRGAVRSVG